jgi:SAM-dependent methyltransferase
VRHAITSEATEGGVNAEAFRPSSERFGLAAGSVVVCDRCGHGSLDETPTAEAVAEAYTDACDPVSLREEDGQVATGLRAVRRIEEFTTPAAFLDVGCWTGSLVEAARQRGWNAIGIEPSAWASDRARQRGLTVLTGDLSSHSLDPGSFRAVAMCDVLEHLERPADAVDEIHRLLEPGGVFYLTVPDAGSLLAKAMGRRWWSVLPMHLQYYTRDSMARLLNAHGFRVVSQHTHTKTFTARYYAERLAGYRPEVGRAAVAALEKVGKADRLVAPNFGDRLEVVAISR